MYFLLKIEDIPASYVSETQRVFDLFLFVFYPRSLGFHDPIWRLSIFFRWVAKKHQVDIQVSSFLNLRVT